MQHGFAWLHLKVKLCWMLYSLAHPAIFARVPVPALLSPVGSVCACRCIHSGVQATMVYHKNCRRYCHVCQTCRPKSWYRCNLCGVWMGKSCNWGWKQRSQYEFPEGEYIGWHCLIQTKKEKISSGRYAVMCERCARGPLWDTAVCLYRLVYWMPLVFPFLSCKEKAVCSMLTRGPCGRADITLKLKRLIFQFVNDSSTRLERR